MDRLEKLFRKSQNIYRLHELVDSIVAGVQQGSRFSLSEDLVKRMHAVAMNGLLEQPGEYRTAAVRINNSPHKCPNWIEVPAHMTSLCEYLSQNWEARDLVHLSAFVMWRLNWIHPFPNGNGRTARAASYLVLCARHGALLPPKENLIEQIQKNKDPYYALLRRADDIYEAAQSVDHALAEFEQYMSDLLKKQLRANLDH